MTLCKCNSTLGNTGRPGCEALFKQASGLIFTEYRDSTGAINFIDLTTTLNSAYWSGKTNQVDYSKRFFPTQGIKNWEAPREEGVYETWDDGTKNFVRDGVRSANYISPKGTASFIKKFSNYRCKDIGVFVIDKVGNLRGSFQEADKLYPIRLSPETFTTVLDWANGSQNERIPFSFDFHPDEKDEYLYMIVANTLPSGVNLLTLEGLKDVKVKISNITTTGFKAKFYIENGDLLDPFIVKGLVAGDFTLAEVTPTPGAIAITSVTDNTATTKDYTFVIPAQTSADVLKLTPSKTGFDFSEVIATAITIP